MSNPILVTGATGLLGNNLVRVLLDRGYPVRVLVRDGYNRRCFAGLELDYATGDLRHADSIRAACRSTSGVIHCAGVVQIGWSRDHGHQQINDEGTRRIVDAARQCGVALIHVSTVNSLSFDHRPGVADETTPWTGDEVPCNYVLSKRAADAYVLSQLAASEGWRANIVYPGFMLGPWDWKPSSGRMMLELSGGGAILAPRGGCSVCDVRDVAAGIIACLEKGSSGDRFILAGYNVTYLELWRQMARIVGVRRPMGTFGPLIAKTAGWAGDLVGFIRGSEATVNSAAIKMSTRFHYYSSALAERELGYRVRPWQESVRDAWRWISEHRG